MHSDTPPRSHKRELGGVESILDEGGLEAVPVLVDFGLLAVVPAAPGESTTGRAFRLLGLGDAVPFSSSGNIAAEVDAIGGVEALEVVGPSSAVFSAARLPTSKDTGFEFKFNFGFLMLEYFAVIC